MDPKVEQVVPKVVLKENAPATPTPTDALAKKLIEQSTADQWREAQKGFKKEAPIDAKIISQKAEQIGVERDPATGAKARTPEEQKRYKSFEDSAELNKNFLEKGYDKLTGSQKTELESYIRDSLNSNPLLSTEFNALTPTDQVEAIKKILKDAKYNPRLREAVNAVLDSNEKMIDDKEIDDKGYDVKDKEYERTDAENAVNDLTAKMTSLDTELKKFDRTPAGATGVKAIELDGLRSNLTVMQQDLETANGNLGKKTSAMKRLEQERAASLTLGPTKSGLRSVVDIDANITSLEGEIDTAKKEVRDCEKKLARINELETQETALKEEKIKAEKDKRDKDIVLKRADLELSKSRRVFEDLKRARTDQENDLVDRIKNTFTEAADAYLADELKAGIEKFDKENEVLKTQTSDKNEQAMRDAFREKWLGTERTRKKGPLGFRKEEKYRPIDKTAVDGDFDAWKTNGSEAYMKRLLMSRRNPASAAGARYTDAEATAMLANKAEGGLFKKMEAEAVTQLLRNKLMSGGISVEDANVVFISQSGKEALTNSIEQNKEFCALIEKMMGEKALINPGFTERFGQLARKKPWLLYSLLGIPALMIGAAGNDAIKDFNVSG